MQQQQYKHQLFVTVAVELAVVVAVPAKPVVQVDTGGESRRRSWSCKRNKCKSTRVAARRSTITVRDERKYDTEWTLRVGTRDGGRSWVEMGKRLQRAER